jgi:hypothetical protein
MDPTEHRPSDIFLGDPIHSTTSQTSGDASVELDGNDGDSALGSVSSSG